MSRSVSEVDPVIRLSDEFVERLRRGENPTVDEYAEKHPDLAVQIRALFPSLRMMEELAPSGSSEDQLAQGPGTIDDAPLQIGDYRVTREIGRGGMGVVYEAEQQSLRRRVALKVLSSQTLGKATALQRFRLEAQAAARLHHTNIVPVYDVGEEDGFWFYCMQLIPGHGLDHVLRELKRVRHDSADETPAMGGAATVAHTLRSGNVRTGHSPVVSDETQQPSGSTVHTALDESTPDRPALPHHSDLSDTNLNRFRYFRGVAGIGIQVARALDYAHQEGIVHRDIKPSNLLLDTQANVWVTDFGLAKAQGEDVTQTGDIVGTLRYMAPERFRGWSDPRSDVYGLGMTLYEMLVLRPAFACDDRVELIRRVIHEAPPLPRTIDSRVPRELETIVLKAINKEPAARYQTAAEAAEDLQRFLDDKPILARRAGPFERSWRWCRRNALVATLGALLIGALSVGCIGMYRLWKTSEEQRVRAVSSEELSRDAVDRFVQLVMRDESLSHSYRRRVFELAIEYYSKFIEQSQDDFGLHRELATTHERVGAMQGMLGDWSSALRSFQQQRDILTGLVEIHLGDKRIQTDLAGAYRNLADAHYQRGAAPQALQFCEQAGAVLDSLPPGSNTPAVAEIEADVLATHAKALHAMGETRQALKLAKQVLELRQRLYRGAVDMASSDGDGFARGLAGAYSFTAVLQSHLGELDEAQESTRQAILLFQRNQQRHPTSPEAAFELANSWALLASLQLSSGQFEKALGLAEDALGVLEPFAEADPNRRFGWHLMHIHDRVASAHFELGHVEQAHLHYQKAVELQNTLVRAIGGDVASISTHYGNLLRFHGDGKQAISHLKESLKFCQNFLADRPWHVATRHELGTALGSLADGYAGSKKFADQAEEWLQEAIALHEQLAADYPDVPKYRVRLAGHYRVLASLRYYAGQKTEALEHTRNAAGILSPLRDLFPEWVTTSHELARLHYLNGLIYNSMEDHDDAIAAYRLATDRWREIHGDTPPGNVNAAVLLGGCYCNLGRLLLLHHNDASAAEAFAERAVNVLESALESDKNNRVAPVFLGNSRKLLQVSRARANH